MSYNIDQAKFKQIAQDRSALLLFKKIPTDVITPVSSMIKIAKSYPDNHFLLESSEKSDTKGRFSVIGLMPDLIWKCQDQKSFLGKVDDDFKMDDQDGNPLENLRSLINESQINQIELSDLVKEIPAMSSGIFGYMGYDMVRLMEKLPDLNHRDEIQIPDSIFIRPQIIIIFDNLFDHALICAPYFENSSNQSYQDLLKKIEDVEDVLASKDEVGEKIDFEFNFQSSHSEEEYCNNVLQAKEYIKAGDIFQVLPSQRFTSDFDERIPPFNFYRSLRSVNPSPFLFYLKFDDFVLTGSSPEIMVSLKSGKVIIRPLAGTRKRGKNDDEDKKIATDLLSDEKEIAEHLMLIDLGRHDVGRVAKQGTVEVTKKMIIEYYSHVMHISSNVEGDLREGLDALDALIAGFPPGTISGAPKIRAMEIIEKIEKIKRSFYSGCVGYFAGNGDMETCITLRSALIKDKKIYLQSGAGIVYDSNPKSEHQECLNKAQALVKACQEIKNYN